MRSGSSFPDDQAEVVLGDAFVEYLDRLTESEQIRVIEDVVALCHNPAGKHPLSNKAGSHLAGWNTLDVLGGEHRVVFASRVVDGVGTLEILCAGPRRADAAYTIASALIATGHLTDDEITEIWQALALLDVVAEDVGLDGWDYTPVPAPDGLRRSAVAAGVLDEETAALLSRDEINAAMEAGWGPSGADRTLALDAALHRARSNARFHGAHAFADRLAPRCGALMPRARQTCIRKHGHPGPHRSVA